MAVLTRTARTSGADGSSTSVEGKEAEVTSETELAWAAGFFEGEGTVSAARPKRRLRIRAAISQNGGAEARTLLERFTAAVGVGNVLGPYDYAGRYPNTPTKKPRYVVQYQNDAAVAQVMGLLDPYLSASSPKRARYHELLAEAQRETGGEQPS